MENKTEQTFKDRLSELKKCLHGPPSPVHETLRFRDEFKNEALEEKLNK